MGPEGSTADDAASSAPSDASRAPSDTPRLPDHFSDYPPTAASPSERAPIPDPAQAPASSPTSERSRQRRRRRSSRRRSRSPLRPARRWLEERGETLLVGLVALTVVASVLCVGTVHVGVLVAVAPVALLCGLLALWLRGKRVRELPAPVVVLGLLALYTALQAVPLPVGLLAAIAPDNADVWARSLHPFGESGPSAASISIDPGATLVEALKWLCYASMFLAAAAIGRAKGARTILMLVFASGLALALVTLGHGMARAETLYGIYEPHQARPQWALSPLLNTNNLAGYLNLTLFSGLGLLVSDRPVLPRWLLGLGIACMVGVTVVSASRGGVLTLIIGAVAVTFALAAAARHRRRRRRKKGRGETPPPTRWQVWLPLGATLLGGTVLALLGANDLVWKGLLDESTEKLAIVEWTKPMIAAHPWFGVGRGAFETGFPPYQESFGTNVIYTHAENFAAQWVSEWGLPVGVGAFLALLWLLRPSRLRARGDRVTAAACVGVVALLLQNLVDLALEVTSVSIAAAVLLGGLWGAPSARRRRRRRSQDDSGDDDTGDDDTGDDDTGSFDLPPRRRVVLAPLLLALFGTAALAAVVTWGMHPALDDRTELQQMYVDADLSDLAASNAFRQQLHAAIVRHPGDPFLPLLGALEARRRPDGKPLRWLARAVERDPTNGRPHLTLAEVFARAGARGQALLELRLAVERDPVLTGRAAAIAVQLTDDFRRLEQAVPEGPAGASMLAELGARIPRNQQPALRKKLLRAAMGRDPALTRPRSVEASDLLAELAQDPPSKRCTPRRACVDRIQAHIKVIDEQTPDSPQAHILHAQLLALDDKHADAEKLLAENCGRYRNATACWRQRVVVANQMRAGDALGEAMSSYLASACTRPPQCASAAEWLGGLLAKRGDWAGAAAKYERAAREDPTAARWLRLAESAARAGQATRARHALRRAKRSHEEPDPKQLERVEKALQKALFDDLSPKP